VPITGQTFGVLFTGALLGNGLPVFAGLKGGYIAFLARRSVEDDFSGFGKLTGYPL
jgi:biotin transporter BioY